MARAVAEKTDPDPDARRRAQVRWASGLVALVLVATAAIVLTRHQAPPRSSHAFCLRIQASKDLTAVLASGDADQIRAAVARFDQAEQVAPLGIDAQLRVITTYADGLAAALARTSDAEQALAAAVRAQEGQNARVESAGQALERYVRSTCAITLDTSTTT